MSMTFNMFFNPYDPNHLKAWLYHKVDGKWPKWFQDVMDADGVVMEDDWEAKVTRRMATFWAEYMIEHTEDYKDEAERLHLKGIKEEK